MASTQNEQPNYLKVLKFSYKQFDGFILSKIIILILPVMWALNFSLSPYLIKRVIDTVGLTTSKDLATIVWPIGTYLVWVGVLMLALTLDDYFVFPRTIPLVRNRIIKELSGKLFHQDQQFFQKNQIGTLVAQISDASEEIANLLRVFCWGLLKNSFMIIIATVTLWQAHYLFGIALLCWASLFTLLAYSYSKKIASDGANWSRLKTENSGRLVDVLLNILAVRFFSAKDSEIEKIDQFGTRVAQSERNLEYSYHVIWLYYKLTYFAYLAFCMGLLVALWRVDSISVGTFAMIFQINMLIGGNFWQLVMDLTVFMKACAKIWQALSSISLTAPTILDAPDAKPLDVKEGKIEFKNVTFNYPGCQDPIFNNKTIVIEPNQKVGLVGLSGSGKTTFVNMILRNFDTTDGQILIDDQPIKSVTLDSLRKSIAIIPQDALLFCRTVYENIAYGRSDATREEVLAAAKLAQAHEFILGLPQGYETPVGERGGNLSGGQRQRIAIARAILKNSKILILDEATSQIDTFVEHQIQSGLMQVMKNKTVVAIAHRLSTIEKMDKILVFHKGKIVQSGTHEELSAVPGLYKTLLDAQAHQVQAEEGAF